MEEINNWQTLIDDEDYEISTEFPFPIRRKSNGNIVKESIDKGYYRLHLNQKKYYKHIIVAKQFIENDDPINKTCVDHINRNKLDYIF